MKKLMLSTFSLIVTTLAIFFVNNALQEEVQETAHVMDNRVPYEAKGIAAYEALIRGEVEADEDGNLFESPQSKTYPNFYRIKEFEKAERNSRFKRKKGLTWTERGPGNFSGRVTSLLIDPNDINTWYAGTAGGGIFKTMDYGKNWKAKTDALPSLIITTVAMSKANSNILYTGTGEQFALKKGHGNGMFKSIDGGENWNRLLSTEESSFVHITRIIVNPNNADSLVVSTSEGIFYSWDGGLSFKKAIGLTGKITDFLFVPGKFSIQYAALDKTGIYKSTDNGVNWKKIKVLKDVKRITLAISKSNPNTIYGLTDLKNGYSGIFKSPDAGITWYFLDQSDKNDVNVFINKGTKTKGGQGWYDQALVVNPYNSNLFFVGGIDIYKASTKEDTVLSITRLTNGYKSTKLRPHVHVDQHVIVYIDKGNGKYDLLFGNDGGIFLSTDEGKTFVEKRNGLRNVQFYGATRSSIEKKYFAGAQDNGNWLSFSDPNEKSIWKKKLGGDGFNVVWNYANEKQLIGGSQHQQLRKSTNGGKTFSRMKRFTGYGKGSFINFIATSQRFPKLLVVPANTKLYVSYNFGKTWDKRRIPGRRYKFSKHSFVVRTSDANPSIIWAGDYIWGNKKRIALSVDAGLSFTKIKNPINIIEGSVLITGISTHPTKDSTAYVLLSNYSKPHILRTEDLGKTWVDISDNNGFPDVATFDLQVMPHNPNELWVGTEIGLFISYDNGGSWQYSNNGLPAVSIRDIHIVKDEVLLATHGRGLFTTTIPEYLPSTAFIKPVFIIKKHEVFNKLLVTVVNFSQNDSMTLNYGIAPNNKTLRLGKRLKQGRRRYSYPVDEEGLYTFYINTYLNNKIYTSDTVNFDVKIKDEGIVDSYYIDFDANFDSLSYSFKGLKRKKDPNFSNKALHSPHPYSNKKGYSFTIKKPLRISHSNSILKFDEVVLVETPEKKVFDYVRVLASKDLRRWKSITSKYNSRKNDIWYTTYKKDTANSIGNSSLIKEHVIDLSQYYNEGDVVFFHFQLVSDQRLTSWGWFIDNINAQGHPVPAKTVKKDGPQADMSFLFAQNPSFPKNAYILATSDVMLDTIYGKYETKTKKKELLNFEGLLGSSSRNFYISKSVEIVDGETNNFYITTRAINKFGNPNVSTLTDTFSVDTYTVNSAEGRELILSNVEVSFQKNSYDSDTKLLISQYKNRSTPKGKIVEQVSLYTLSKKDLNRTMDIYFSFKGEAKDYSVYQRKSENWEEVSNIPRNDKLIVSTRELGTYALVKLDNARDGIPKELSYKLKQNYPNPFNPETVIPFELKRDGHIVLRIYNSLGQKVRTLINKFYSKGSNKIMWDGRNDSREKVSSGVYFYQLISSEKTITKKMLFLK